MGATAVLVLQDGRQRNSHPIQVVFRDFKLVHAVVGGGEKAETRGNGIRITENLKYGTAATLVSVSERLQY